METIYVVIIIQAIIVTALVVAMMKQVIFDKQTKKKKLWLDEIEKIMAKEKVREVEELKNL